MFQLTERAGKALMMSLAIADAPEDVRVRLAADSEGFSLDFDVEQFNDDVFAIGGKRVLIVDSTSAETLEDVTLDVRGTNFCLVPQPKQPLGWFVPPNFDPSLN